ncbi:MutS-related protein [Wenyingzhuangia sp. IMCC45574]
MYFELDEQTKKDLSIFPSKNNAISVFSIFDKTKTGGGSDCLLRMLKTPSNDLTFLEERKNNILFTLNASKKLYLEYNQLNDIEFYLRIGRASLHDNFIDALIEKVSYQYKPNSDYYNIQNGILQLYKLHLEITLFLKANTNNQQTPFYTDFQEKALKLSALLKKHIKLTKKGKIHYRSISKLDVIFRKKEKNFIQEFLNSIYQIDVFNSVCTVIKEHKFTLPEYTHQEQPTIKMEAVWHPFLATPKPNNLEIGHQHKNVIFLTGSNMAGKSTFLKSIGIAMYLAHIGFPVPAKKMQTTLHNCISTSINLSDDITSGQSHYYSEVMRIKEVAETALKKGNSFVLFDELFKGTNFKDALEASQRLMNQFAQLKNSLFIVSSHISEIADYLNPKEDFLFNCFTSKIVENQLSFDYILKEGISKERIGLQIIKQEKIFELLENIKTMNS